MNRTEIGQWLDEMEGRDMANEPTNELLDAAVALIASFKNGEIRDFNREANKLAAMTGRTVYAYGWEKRHTIKNLADGIVRRESS